MPLSTAEYLIRLVVLAAPRAGLVVAQTDKDGVTEQSVVGPGEIRDLGDENGSDPVDARQREATADARLALRRDGEGRGFDRERRKTCVQRGEGFLRHAGSDPAGVEETLVVVVIGEEKGAEIGSRPFGVGPAGDDEFAAVEAFRFGPGAAVAWEIGPVEALGDDAFEAVAASGSAERLAVAGLMGAEVDAGGGGEPMRAARRLLRTASGMAAMGSPLSSRRSNR
jgi:hypothetical protein